MDYFLPFLEPNSTLGRHNVNYFLRYKRGLGSAKLFLTLFVFMGLIVCVCAYAIFVFFVFFGSRSFYAKGNILVRLFSIRAVAP